MNGRSIRSYIADTQAVSPMPSVSSSLIDLPAQVHQLSNVVEALSNKIDNITCTPSQPVWPTSNTPVWPKRNMKRRRIDDKPDSQATSECGTNNVDLSDLSVPTVVQNVRKFWLYLSGLNPLITDADVQKIVSRCLSIPESMDVIRLVPKGKDITGLSFVSYKIGLSPEMENKALDASTWPTGLLFRQFVDQPKNWNRPAAYRSPLKQTQQ